MKNSIAKEVSKEIEQIYLDQGMVLPAPIQINIHKESPFGIIRDFIRNDFAVGLTVITIIFILIFGFLGLIIYEHSTHPGKPNYSFILQQKKLDNQKYQMHLNACIKDPGNETLSNCMSSGG